MIDCLCVHVSFRLLTVPIISLMTKSKKLQFPRGRAVSIGYLFQRLAIMANDCKIWVGGLPEDVTEGQLHECFDSCGTVTKVQIRKSARDTFCFITFDRASSVQQGMRMDKSTFFGRPIKVNYVTDGPVQKPDKGHGKGGKGDEDSNRNRGYANGDSWSDRRGGGGRDASPRGPRRDRGDSKGRQDDRGARGDSRGRREDAARRGTREPPLRERSRSREPAQLRGRSDYSPRPSRGDDYGRGGRNDDDRGGGRSGGRDEDRGRPGGGDDSVIPRLRGAGAGGGGGSSGGGGGSGALAPMRSDDPENVNRAWVGGLPKDITEQEIRRHFKRCGNVVEVRIHDAGAKDSFAFVQFENWREAKECIETMNLTQAFGVQIKVNRPSTRPPTKGGDKGKGGGKGGGGGSTRLEQRDRGRSASRERPRERTPPRREDARPERPPDRRRRVRLDRLPEDMDREELMGICSDYGRALNLEFWSEPDGWNAATVDFERPEVATEVFDVFDDRRVQGWHLRIRARLEEAGSSR
eukprot:TRINITY_DN12532_c0_g1_i3.p1 TRINITY_DN12532_c0_g1~~TRINITY_DN12532_c0_g1_i3.p1  ORF type:complete len:523 (+),score=105.32 TRINITY_DN12532_c0_g1_i3:1284-2852(+)